MNPRFPIYIVSKGRWDSRITARYLQMMKVPFRIVVEESERHEYRRFFDEDVLLTLDPEYQRKYETCDDLGDTKSKGPGPARNFAWDHAISLGYDWHWVMDDNIRGFWRMNRNMKVPVADGTVLRCMEDFVLRYRNIAMAGPNYYMFAPQKQKSVRPYILNTRIYSCNLIRNDIPFRWRGRYNEDTILSLDVLTASWCTVQFNAFLQLKCTTQTVKGGNHKEFYAQEGTLPKTLCLTRTYPTLSRVVKRFGRWHHHVDYRPFAKTRLLPREDRVKGAGVNNYGMELIQIAERRIEPPK